VLLDCCQGTGKRAYDLDALGVHFASVAGHKFGAPKGVGALYVRNGVALAPLIPGGRQQQDRRSGTEDAAAACALAAALRESLAHAEREDARQRALLDGLWQRLSRALPDCRWLARGAERLANTMNLAHPGCVADHLVMRLDLAGFSVSIGAACMAARGQPSHVIAALGLAPEFARSAVRVSIGPGTTEEDVLGFGEVYVREVRALIVG
jgi:cysteine desulfurase